jgi:chaperonin GroES
MLKAVSTRIIVKKSEAVRTTASGIVLQSDISESNHAQVLDIGPEVKLDIKIGDSLVVDWRTVAQTKLDGETYFVVDAGNVLARVE